MLGTTYAEAEQKCRSVNVKRENLTNSSKTQVTLHFAMCLVVILLCIKVKVDNDQEMAQSERNYHSKNI